MLMRRTFLQSILLLPVALISSYQVGWAQSSTSLSPNSVTIKAPSGTLVQGLALSVDTDKQGYMGGDAILLKIALVNSTDSYHYRLVVGSASVFDLFDFDLRYADEGQVPLTAFGVKRLKRSPGPHLDPFSVFGLSVPPGQSLVYQVVISRLFDMSRGGTYWITARWHDPSADIGNQHSRKRPSAFVSNQTAVRVEEPDPEFYGGNGFAHH